MPQLPEKNIIRNRYVIFNPKEKSACPLVIHNQDTGRVIMVHAIYMTSIREKYFKKYSFETPDLLIPFPKKNPETIKKNGTPMEAITFKNHFP